MRLACTSKTGSSVVQIMWAFVLMLFVEHIPYHQPPPYPAAQLSSAQTSLSLSGVLNSFPLAIWVGYFGSINASPASPLYPATVSWYLPTSSLMENVEYSAEYHRPEVRWTYSIATDTRYWRCSLPFVVAGLDYLFSY